MQEGLEAIDHQYRTTEKMIREILPHLSHDDLVHAPAEGQSSVLHLYGHVTTLRHRLFNAISPQPVAVPFEDVFGGFAKPAAATPSKAAVDAAFADITLRLHERFATMTPQELSAPGRGQGEFPTDDGTMLGTIAFLAYHEAYTVGQMGYLGHLRNKLPKVGHLG